MGRHKKGTYLSRIACTTIAWLIIFTGSIVASDVVILSVDGAITPPVASYIVDNIDYAIKKNAEAVIIQIDTPGGLDTSMREIIKKELNADIPVVVYVAPQGARAASAGALITIAADIAAMAPGTNLGAAHPVSIGMGRSEKDTTMEDKVVNDAASYARSIAKTRGRNESWAEDAVRKSISTPAEEALEKGVINIVAESTTDLLLKLDGRTIKKNKNTFTLHTKTATIIERPMGFRARLLSVIANPNVAYILLMIGLAGLYFELSNPGVLLPGIVGGISLILAFFAFQTLPVNYAGVALILLAIVLFIAEIKVPSFGLLSVGGVISLLLGSVILFRAPGLYAKISWGIVLPVALMFALFFVVTVFLVVRVHRKPSLSGREGLIGELATVLEWNVDGTGKIFCHGEYWNASGPATLKQGDKVKVKEVEHLQLKVEPAESER